MSTAMIWKSPEEILRAKVPKVIGMSGVAGSGKDTLTDLVLLNLGFLPLALADPFKTELVAKGEIPFEEAFYGRKSPATRKLLQDVGESRRKEFGETLWCNTAEITMARFAARGFERFVITDVRMQHEVDLIRKYHGRVYRIVGRGGIDGEGASHSTETALDGQDTLFDRVFNNSVENQFLVRQELYDAVLGDLFLGYVPSLLPTGVSV